MGATDHPLFRTDLVSRPIEADGHRFIEVIDPDSGSSFRFYEVEYAIACAMDGERDLGGLADWARIELGLDPSPDEIRTVVTTLGDLGYLDTGAPLAVAHSSAVTQPVAAPPVAAAPPAQPPPLDRPPPAGRSAGPSPFDFGAPPAPSSDAMARHFGDGSSSSPPVSMDLSEHIPLRAQDVKEAVRQSRAMQAVRPEGHRSPTDDDAFDEEKTPPPIGFGTRAPAAAAADVGRHPVTPAQAQLAKTLLGTPAPALPGTRPPTPSPMVLPEKPIEFGRPGPTPAPPVAVPARQGAQGWERSVAPARAGADSRGPVPAPQSSSSLVPYIIVILLLVGAGLGAYWWFFLREDGIGTESQGALPSAPATVEQTQDDRPAPPAPAPPPEPPRPAEVVAALEAGPTQERQIVATQAGRVLWVAPAGGEVSEGAPVAKLDGFQKWEYAVKEAQDSQRRYQERLDQATARGDKDAMREAEGNVKRKQGDIEKNQSELEPFLIKAPIGGIVELAIKKGAMIKKDQAVAKILAQSSPRAAFILPAGTTYGATEARVGSKSDASLEATCKVESSEPGKLVVSCPTDSGLASGTEVVLKSL